MTDWALYRKNMDDSVNRKALYIQSMKMIPIMTIIREILLWKGGNGREYPV